VERERRQRKNEIIALIQANNASLPVRNVVSLIQILIQEARESNDDAEPQEVLRNQGQIKGLKALMDDITKDVSQRSITSKPDLA
jgi:hypothetical protein